MMKRFLILSLMIIQCLIIHGQKQDHIWLFGIEPFDVTDSKLALDTTAGASYLDFNVDPPKFVYDAKRHIDFRTANASICDVNGQLQIYSNGQVIYNGFHQVIEDTINYGEDWEYHNRGTVTFAIPTGLLIPFSVFILPSPGSLKDHYLFYSNLNRTSYKANFIRFSKVNFDPATQKGALTIKDSIMQIGVPSLGGYTACRHANGRDWWMIIPDDSTRFNIFLIDPVGIHHKSKVQIGRLWPFGVGTSVFSPDGQYFTSLSSYTFGTNAALVKVIKFDREKGTFGKFVEYNQNGEGVSAGFAYSNNSKYLYSTDGLKIYQNTLDSNQIIKSRRLVATYDGYKYVFPLTEAVDSFGWATDFGYFGQGPDGRIYISPTSNACRQLGVIDFPEEFGLGCTVKQHYVFNPTWFAGTMPNFANYRLGPLDGSPCDTLGLDNHPIAKYRYEPDSIDYKRIRFTDLSYFRPETWSWDFGDGSPKISIKSPYHTFPKDGTYKVCLTVSNENSSNTSCRDITIGVSAIDDESEHPIDVNIFPNPVQDILLVTIGEYVPAQAYIEFYNALGQQVLRQRVYYGHNNVDMTGLSAGVYAWRIVDRGVLVKSGEVVKM